MSSYTTVVLASGATIRRDPQTKKIIFSDRDKVFERYMGENSEWKRVSVREPRS